MKKILLSLLVFLIILCLINYEQLRVDILTELVISRGVVSVNCFWYKITELFFKDASGINLFNDLKKKYGDFAFTNVFGKDCYLVTNINDIKYVLDNSPYLFNVGELKLKFFNKNHFTDVIAFRLNSHEEPKIEGEIYISLPRAKENSVLYDEPYRKEVARLIIHGCLHIMGYNDETINQKKRMNKLENNFLDNMLWTNLF